MSRKTVLGKENFIYKYECRQDKLLVSTHSGKRQETLYIRAQVNIMLDSRIRAASALNRQKNLY